MDKIKVMLLRGMLVGSVWREDGSIVTLEKRRAMELITLKHAKEVLDVETPASVNEADDTKEAQKSVEVKRPRR